MTGADDLNPYDELQDALRFTSLKVLRVVKIVCPHYNELLDVLRVNGRLIVVHGSLDIVWKPQTWTPFLIKSLETHGLNPSNFKLDPGPVPVVRHGDHKVYTYLDDLGKDAESDSPTFATAAPRCCTPRVRTMDLPWLHDAVAEYSGEVNGKRVKVYGSGKLPE